MLLRFDQPVTLGFDPRAHPLRKLVSEPDGLPGQARQ